MTKIPHFGRNVPYIAAFAIYLILSVPTALANGLGRLLVLRFLQGFFGSPLFSKWCYHALVLLTDFEPSLRLQYGWLYLLFLIGIWAARENQLNAHSVTFLGLAAGPMPSSFSIVAESEVVPRDWHLPRLLIFTGDAGHFGGSLRCRTSLHPLVLLPPGTSADAILLQRAQRL